MQPCDGSYYLIYEENQEPLPLSFDLTSFINAFGYALNSITELIKVCCIQFPLLMCEKSVNLPVSIDFLKHA